MRRFRRLLLSSAIAGCLSLHSPAHAQTVGGNASLSAGTTTSSVALPASLQSYPSVLILPQPGATFSGEAYFKFGGSSVTATTGSPTLPPHGVCFANVANVTGGTYFAAITSSGSIALRVTQFSQCPQEIGF